MTNAEIITAIISAIGLIFVLLKGLHELEEDRRALDRRISIVEESTKLSHTRIDSLSDKLEALRDRIK